MVGVVSHLRAILKMTIYSTYLVVYGVCLNWTFSGTDREKEAE